jgi:uncharacterized membrane protein
METKNISKELGVLITLVIPFIFLALIWNRLPEIIPTHFGINGKADHTGSKYSLIGMVAFIMVIGFGVGMLIKFAPKIDPRKAGGISESRLYRMRMLFSLFISAIGCIMIYTCANNDISYITYIPVAMCVLLSGIGNYMNNIKQNSVMGFRTRKTLSNEEVWRKTHHFTSKLWFYSGLVMVPVFLMTPFHYMAFAIIPYLLVIFVIPFVYVNRVYREVMKK